MDNFAPAFQNYPNTVGFNAFWTQTCRDYGQDWDDDLVDDPEFDDLTDDGSSGKHEQDQGRYDFSVRRSSPSLASNYTSSKSKRSRSTQSPPRVGDGSSYNGKKSPLSPVPAHLRLPTRSSSLRHSNLSRTQSPTSKLSPASNFRTNTPRSVPGRQYSFQRAHIIDDSHDFKEKWLDRHSSFTSEASYIPSHPAVRPLESRKVLGEAAGPSEYDDAAEYPSPLPLALIITGLCLSVFIISLDRNIITTAIPRITERFHSYEDIGWYGSAYLLTASAFQPLYGRIYMSFNTKMSFIGALGIFELGSLICAVAPSSAVLIVGRAIQGIGSAGILTGAFVVGTHSVRLRARPILFAFVGILYALGALCGPLLGGAFTDTIGWRWCFWINLPCGFITFVAVFFFFHKPKPSSHGEVQLPVLKRILSLDLIGNAILLGAATQLFIALQLSEAQDSWSSAPVIGLLCGFGVTTLIFVAWILYRKDAALLPLRILRQRTVAASCGAAFFIYGTLLLHSYYLPVYFQAIQNASALHSGVNMIPYMAASAVTSLLAGIFVSKNGLFAPPAIIGCAIGTIGCGLIATFKVGTSTGTWIGYIILASGGIGMAIQQGFSAVQTALPLGEVPIGTAAVVACQSAGGAIFVSVGNTLLQNHLLSESAAQQVPGVDLRVVIELGTTNFRQHVPADMLPVLVRLYAESLQAVFIAAAPLCGCAFLCSLCMEWRSVRREQGKGGSKDVEERI